MEDLEKITKDISLLLYSIKIYREANYSLIKRAKLMEHLEEAIRYFLMGKTVMEKYKERFERESDKSTISEDTYS